MTDTAVLALIAAGSGAATAFIGYLNNKAILASRVQQERQHAENSQKLEATKKAVVELEHNTNGIKDKLLQVTGASEFAKGKIVGAEEERHPPDAKPAA